jgi:hypothetical protein
MSASQDGSQSCPSPVCQYSLITVFGAMSDRQQAAETMNFKRIKRRIELSPYSGIF